MGWGWGSGWVGGGGDACSHAAAAAAPASSYCGPAPPPRLGKPSSSSSIGVAEATHAVGGRLTNERERSACTNQTCCHRLGGQRREVGNIRQASETPPLFGVPLLGVQATESSPLEPRGQA